MSHFCKIFYYLLTFLLFFSCSKLEDISAPFAPKGEFQWIIEVDSEGKGLLMENSTPGTVIGKLNATDLNPYDETFLYSLEDQTINTFSWLKQDVNYFEIVVDSVSGIVTLVTSTDIDFEQTTSTWYTNETGKVVDVTFSVTDDSQSKQTSFFSISLKILNVNESPYFTNINEVVRYADENIEYSFNKVEWTDSDYGQNPTLTYSGPSWLYISSEGQMAGTPQTSDIGNNSFVLTISDSTIDVQQEVNIQVRENLAPLFNNTSSIPQNITVGCWNVNQELVDLSWYDPNNTSPAFTGNDIISLSVVENIGWMNWSEDGKLFCYTAPENSDAGMSNVVVRIEDNRPNSSKATEYQFDLTVIANDAPVFSNLSSFPSEMNSGDTLSYYLEWMDPDVEETTFALRVRIGSNTYYPIDLGWIFTDSTTQSSTNVNIIPGLNNSGNYILLFYVSDGCFLIEEERSFIIN